jgi:hypothetical protein
MIFSFFSQPDSHHSQIFRKAGQKKAEPNRYLVMGAADCLALSGLSIASHRTPRRQIGVPFIQQTPALSSSHLICPARSCRPVRDDGTASLLSPVRLLIELLSRCQVFSTVAFR